MTGTFPPECLGNQHLGRFREKEIQKQSEREDQQCIDEGTVPQRADPRLAIVHHEQHRCQKRHEKSTCDRVEDHDGERAFEIEQDQRLKRELREKCAISRCSRRDGYGRNLRAPTTAQLGKAVGEQIRHPLPYPE